MELEGNLVALWDFTKEGGDELKDKSRNGSHGKVHGAQWNKDKTGNHSLEFDGIDDFVEIKVNKVSPNPFKNLSTGSFSVWFRIDHIPLDHGIMPIFYYGAEKRCDFFDAANNGLIIEVGHSPVQRRSKKLYYTVWANGCTLPSFCFDSNDPIQEKRWYHFVVVVGENYNTGYLDGVELSRRRYNFGRKSDSQFFSSAISHNKIWIGKGFWDRKEMFLKGAVSEIRIYDKPLNAKEVMSIYSKSSVI